MRFSERNGHVAPRLEYQGESMDDALRGDLWNTLYRWYFNRDSYGEIAVKTWTDFLFQPEDLFLFADLQAMARGHVMGGTWTEAYDLIEFVTTLAHASTSTSTPGSYDYDDNAAGFLARINAVLDAHMAGWHVLGGIVTPVTSGREIETVEDALSATSGGHEGAEHHLRAAISALSDRDNPQYANSMRESFLAVEGVAKAVAGLPNADLAAALRSMKHRGSAIDKGLINYWDSLYGRASGPLGLRHAGVLAPDFNAADARYMLVTASAFINLLLTYDTHNAAVGYVPESEIPPSERPEFTADPVAGEPSVTS